MNGKHGDSLRLSFRVVGVSGSVNQYQPNQKRDKKTTIYLIERVKPTNSAS